MYQISKATSLKTTRLTHLNLSFDVSLKVSPPYHLLNQSPELPTQPTGQSLKTYDLPDDIDTSPEETLLLATTTQHGDPLVGFALVAKEWNSFLNIEEIAVDVSHRKAGVGRQLMNAIVKTARDAGASGVRAETQDNNVPACRFYKRYGFRCGGYDEYMYKGEGKHEEEVALFWYYVL